MVLRRIALILTVPVALIATLSGATNDPPTQREVEPLYAPLSVLGPPGVDVDLQPLFDGWAAAEAARIEAERVAAEEAARAAEAARRRPVYPSVGAHSDAFWDAIAQCETGSDFTMHGSIYSTAYGIVNAAIYQNASPEIAQRILSGTATKAEQLAVAKAVWSYAGDRAWGCSPTAWRMVPGG